MSEAEVTQTQEVPVLEVSNLTVALRPGGERAHAVQNISITVNPR